MSIPSLLCIGDKLKQDHVPSQSFHFHQLHFKTEKNLLHRAELSLEFHYSIRLKYCATPQLNGMTPSLPVEVIMLNQLRRMNKLLEKSKLFMRTDSSHAVLLLGVPETLAAASGLTKSEAMTKEPHVRWLP